MLHTRRLPARLSRPRTGDPIDLTTPLGAECYIVCNRDRFALARGLVDRLHK